MKKTNYKFIPRFRYTLSFKYYTHIFSHPKTFSNNIKILFEDSKIISLNNARTGLKLLLKSISNSSLNIGVQVFTCHTVFQAIIRSGHKPVFIDIDENLKLDLADLKNKLKLFNVLIVTHTFGFPDQLDQIREIIGDKILIEDCAHSYLSKYKNNYTGGFGDASVFSTGIGKFPPIGINGYAIVNNPKKFPLFDKEFSKIPKKRLVFIIIDYIKILIFSFIMKPSIYGFITHRIGKKINKKLDLTNNFSFPEYKGNRWAEDIFYNKITYFKKLRDIQTKNSIKYSRLLYDNSPFLNNKIISPNHYIFYILTEDRDKVYESLLKEKIEPGKHFHKCIDWATGFGYKLGDCPVTEKVVKKIITIPTHFELSSKNISKIKRSFSPTLDK